MCVLGWEKISTEAFLKTKRPLTSTQGRHLGSKRISFNLSPLHEIHSWASIVLWVLSRVILFSVLLIVRIWKSPILITAILVSSSEYKGMWNKACGQNWKYFFNGRLTVSTFQGQPKKFSVVNCRGLAPAPPNKLKVSAKAVTVLGETKPQDRPQKINTQITHPWGKVTAVWEESAWYTESAWNVC